jgi:hypothetical protein
LIRKRGIEQAPKVSWVEYSAPFDHPDDMRSTTMRPPNHWAGNPSMDDGLISEETMEDEVDTMPRRVAPSSCSASATGPTLTADRPVISLEAWDALERRSRSCSRRTRSRSTCRRIGRLAIAFAGRNEEGKFHVEIQEFRDGTKWAPRWIARAVAAVRLRDLLDRL